MLRVGEGLCDDVFIKLHLNLYSKDKFKRHSYYLTNMDWQASRWDS